MCPVLAPFAVKDLTESIWINETCNAYIFNQLRVCNYVCVCVCVCVCVGNVSCISDTMSSVVGCCCCCPGCLDDASSSSWCELAASAIWRHAHVRVLLSGQPGVWRLLPVSGEQLRVLLRHVLVLREQSNDDNHELITRRKKQDEK